MLNITGQTSNDPTVKALKAVPLEQTPFLTYGNKSLLSRTSQAKSHNFASEQSILSVNQIERFFKLKIQIKFWVLNLISYFRPCRRWWLKRCLQMFASLVKLRERLPM